MSSALAGAPDALGSIVAGAAAFGLLGSFHCTAMCGPLALAGCRARGALSARAAALYFGGRLVSYVCAGAAFGALGAHLACALHLETLQRAVLFGVGAAALVKGVRLLRASADPSRAITERPVTLRRRPRVRRAAALAAALLPRRGLALGLATGVLPCGFLSGAWALAAATGRASLGALAMSVFAAATAPALGASLLLARAPLLSRLATSARWQGALWCALAFAVLVRTALPAHQHGGP